MISPPTAICASREMGEVPSKCSRVLWSNLCTFYMFSGVIGRGGEGGLVNYSGLHAVHRGWVRVVVRHPAPVSIACYYDGPKVYKAYTISWRGEWDERMCGTQGVDEKCVQNFSRKTQMEEATLETSGMNVWIGFSCLRMQLEDGCCEHDNEP